MNVTTKLCRNKAWALRAAVRGLWLVQGLRKEISQATYAHFDITVRLTVPSTIPVAQEPIKFKHTTATKYVLFYIILTQIFIFFSLCSHHYYTANFVPVMNSFVVWSSWLVPYILWFKVASGGSLSSRQEHKSHHKKQYQS